MSYGEKEFCGFNTSEKSSKCKNEKHLWGTSLVVQWLRLHIPKARDQGLIPGQGTRPLPTEVGGFLCAITKTQCSLINQNF